MAVQEGTFTILANKMMFANKLSLLYKATADTETPTPGYMFQEIINISNESGSHCVDLLEVLNERLQEDSCNVKLKVLRIMKHVVEKGHPDFSSALRKKSRGIQTATKHNGPSDPLHGNVPYLLVRKEAQSLLSVLFDVKDDTLLASQEPQMKPMGSISSVGIGSVDQSGTLRGFGNTPMREKSLGESFISGLKDVAEKVLDPQPPGRDVRTKQAPSFGQYKPVSLDSSTDVSMKKSSSLSEVSLPTSMQSSVRGRGRPGGGWDDETVQIPLSRQHTERLLEQEQSFDAPNDNIEDKLIEKWTEVSSQDSLLPTRKEVEEFVKECSGQNFDRISSLLSNKLVDQKDPVLLRTMLVLERLLHLDLVNSEHISETCSAHLSKLKDGPAGAVQSKARKLFCVLDKLCISRGLMDGDERQADAQHDNGFSQ